MDLVSLTILYSILGQAQPIQPSPVYQSGHVIAAPVAPAPMMGKQHPAPNGAHMSSKGVDAVPPLSSCPGGYTETSTGCLFYEEIEPEYLCPKETKLDGQHCVRENKSEPVFSCPPGSVVDEKKKKCYKREETTYDVECPKGYTSDGTSCLRVQISDLLYKCPKGYSIGPTGDCFKSKKCDEVIYNCEPGYYLDNDKKYCIAYHEAEPIFECKKGSLEGLECVDHKYENPEAYCAKDYKLDGNVCSRWIEAKPDSRCVNGEFDGKDCVYELKDKPTVSCKKKDYQLIGGKCVRIIEEDPEVHCGEKKSYSDGWCVERVREKSQDYCENGFEMDDKKSKCIKTEAVSPNYSCKKGELGRDGQCHESSKYGPDIRCPKGYKLDNGVCISEEKTKPEEYCPNDTVVLPAEVYCKAGDVAHDHCEVVDMKEPKKMCPKGYVDVDNFCAKDYEVEGEEVCQSGEFKKGKCYQELITKPSLICKEKEYVLSANGMCTRAIAADVEYYCPSGYVLSNGACVRSDPLYFAQNSGIDIKKKKNKEGHHGSYNAIPQGHSSGAHHVGYGTSQVDSNLRYADGKAHNVSHHH